MKFKNICNSNSNITIYSNETKKTKNCTAEIEI